MDVLTIFLLITILGYDTSMAIIKWISETDLDSIGRANIEGYLKYYLKSKKLI